MNNQCLRLTGSGGQGVILASVILAEAAVIAGKYTDRRPEAAPARPNASFRITKSVLPRSSIPPS